MISAIISYSLLISSIIRRQLNYIKFSWHLSIDWLNLQQLLIGLMPVSAKD